MNVEAEFQRGKSLHQAGRFEQAEATYRAVLQRQPQHAEAMHFLGVLKGQQKKLEEAIELLSRSVQLRPRVAMFWNNLGEVLNKAGRFDEAIAAFERAMSLVPPQAHLYYNLGLARSNQYRRSDAITALRTALQLNPNIASAHRVLGEQLIKKGDWTEGAAHLRRAIELGPSHFANYVSAAAGWVVMGKAEEALVFCEHALTFAPDAPEVHAARGQALHLLARLNEAQNSYRRAIELDAGNPAHHSDLAGVLTDAGRLEEALAEHQLATALKPTEPTYLWNRALTRLMSGDEGGWIDFDAHRKLPDTPWRRRYPGPRLESTSDVRGRTVLMHAEYGLGDTIQFVRYANVLAARGAEVIVDCQSQIAELVATIKGVKRVVSDADELPRYDFYCPVIWAPAVLGTAVATGPGCTPYVFADAAKVKHWNERLSSEKRLKVAIVWSGNPQQSNNVNRSVPAGMIGSLACEGVALYALQKGLPPGERTPAAFVDLAPQIESFTDTAAIMEAMNLVVSVCTASAHVAGALGRPVWTMLSYMADFRWLKECPTSAWYPTMKLFRQPSPRNWDAVLAEVRKELLALVRQRAGH